MLDLTQTITVIVLIVISVITTAVGIQIFLLLKEARGTLKRTNDIIDTTEGILEKVSHPTASLGNLLTGLKEGAHVIESVTSLFHKNKSEYPYDHE